MAETAAEFFARQDTALIVRVPEAEEAVGRWRAEHDSSAALGVPAHVTILFPWIPNLRIEPEDLDAVRGLCRWFEPFDATFSAVGALDEVIWMRPDSEEPFRDLTTAVWEGWPDFPPYDGRFDDVIPHLTIADGDVEGLLPQIQESLGPSLPITTHVAELELITFQDGRWGVTDVFPLGG